MSDNIVEKIQKAKEIKKRLRRFTAAPDELYEQLSGLRQEVGLSGIEEIVGYGETIRDSVIASQISQASIDIIEKSTDIINEVEFEGYKVIAELAMTYAQNDRDACTVIEHATPILSVVNKEELYSIARDDFHKFDIISTRTSTLKKRGYNKKTLQDLYTLGKKRRNYSGTLWFGTALPEMGDEDMQAIANKLKSLYDSDEKSFNQIYTLCPRALKKTSNTFNDLLDLVALANSFDIYSYVERGILNK